jgi:hypothetical protein
MKYEHVVHTSDWGIGQLIARWAFGGSNTVMCLSKDVGQHHQVRSNRMIIYPREVEACVEVVVMDSLKKGRRQGVETAVRSETRHRVITSKGGDDYTTQGCLRGHISNC